MIKINVAEIKKQLIGSASYHYDLEAGDLDLQKEDVELDGPVSADFTLSNGGDMILLEGKLQFRVKTQCARCLKDIVLNLTADLDERYYPEGTEGLEEDAMTYKFDMVDVTDALRESLLLSVPARALCKPDCKGICPVCGADRNVTPCHCETRSIDPRLQALEALLKK
ncbi:MAG: DUF177 domain-containing protein [Acidaminococcus sp.]|jgi:uncharacterized protein|nr:DUF177 domain-containing protein [Acidaminococcus sp.]MCI2101016.1 DUF177 domain-containing protein [Acidaminococcus sp.]MCI2115430.1 DUF177 domain-containing protein [Acidaminococcus sp.]MCI2117517.1 DUF177 domain-containing protein [Acidaminococcus sp.]